jgi:membrane-associated phospholipid phosphatase
MHRLVRGARPRLLPTIGAVIGLLTSTRVALAEDRSTAPMSPAKTPGEYSFAPDEVCPYCALTPQFPDGRSGLHWHDHWSAVGLREYVTIPLLVAANFALPYIAPEQEADWTGPILFDRSVRDAVRLDGSGARSTAGAVSDALFVISYVHPLVIDNLLVTWWGHEAPRVAWQMSVINAQAYALTFAFNGATKRFTSRARPWVEGCDTDPTGESCGSGGRYSSFYSGHAAVTATGAGLICAHHTQLSLYRNPMLDTGACLTAIAGTALTGGLRIASDNHWTSDVLVGHLMGYFSGYLLPTLLYYKQFSITPHDHPTPGGPVFAILPGATETSAQLNVVGLF